ncbi:MAG: ABC transporter ATP-binding protein [bacterium]|nr:ABC transporter ATP-binding protein [bacterium]
MDKILNVNNISGGYGKTNVLHDISFSVEEGDFLGIIGPNGSGKSTLLRLLTRVLKPDKGRIFFKNQNLTEIDLKALFRKVAFVAQDTQFNFAFNVWDIVLMGRIPHLRRLQVEKEHDFLIAEKALNMTDSIHLKYKRIDKLSAGEKQRVIISRALAQEPRLLFLDEPVSHLDIGHQMQVLDLLRVLNKEKSLTIIMVLHDLNMAGEYCDRLLLLNKGKLIVNGFPSEVLNKYNIESVYKTKVLVKKSPVSKQPYTYLIPGGSIKNNRGLYENIINKTW